MSSTQSQSNTQSTTQSAAQCTEQNANANDAKEKASKEEAKGKGAKGGKRRISPKFSGKWVRQSTEGKEREFLLLLGRSKLEAKIAPLSSEVQIVQQFLVEDEHYIQTQVNMRVAKVKSHEYGIFLWINGRHQKQAADSKGFGDCSSVSKFTNDSSYATIYHLKDKCTLVVKRTLIDDNHTKVDLKVSKNGKSAECSKIYERSSDWEPHDQEVLSLIRRGREGYLYQ